MRLLFWVILLIYLPAMAPCFKMKLINGCSQSSLCRAFTTFTALSSARKQGTGVYKPLLNAVKFFVWSVENKGSLALTTVPLSPSVVSSAVLTHYCTSGTWTLWHCVCHMDQRVCQEGGGVYVCIHMRDWSVCTRCTRTRFLGAELYCKPPLQVGSLCLCLLQAQASQWLGLNVCACLLSPQSYRNSRLILSMRREATWQLR